MRRLGALLLILCGCAAHPKAWTKEGAGADDFYRDDGQCKAQAFGVSAPSAIQIAIVYSSCMHGKGWRQE